MMKEWMRYIDIDEEIMNLLFLSCYYYCLRLLLTTVLKLRTIFIFVHNEISLSNCILVYLRNNSELIISLLKDAQKLSCLIDINLL